jgi:hypothetical protein
MEIDLERTKRAMAQFGAAIDEARRAIRPGRSGVIRVHTGDSQIDLPVAWAAAGLAALALAAMLGSGSPKRAREEEPLGIG